MRLMIKKSLYKSVGIWTFLLLFILRGVFPEPACALLSSLDACAVKPECAEAIGLELSSTIAAPTAEAAGTTAISTTTATGATSSVQAVAGTTVVGDMRLSGVAAFYIWNRAQNEQAQNKAKERYCFFNALDMVCGPQGQSSVLYNYKFHQTVHYRMSGYPDKLVTHHYRSWRPVPGAVRSLANQYPGGYFGGSSPPTADYVNWISLNDGDGNNQTRGVVYESSTGDPMTAYDYANSSYNNAEKGWISDLVRADGLPDNLPPRDWKDWPQEKRNAAVQLLNNSDWQGLISSMPEGGRLNPGDKVNAPTVIIPGQEEDDPNTPADERLLKKQSGFFTFPGGLNTDFDKDGTPDSVDPEPQNPNVPTASGRDNSTDQPPDDSLNLPLEQDGPDDQAADAQIDPGDQYLDARAKELASLMDDVARRRRTIAVARVRNPDGTKEEIVASSNGYLNLAQKNSIDQAEKTRLPDDRINKHAEQKIIEWAEANGKTVESIGASRNICSACWAKMQPRNIRPATHVNLPQTQQ